MHEFRAPIGARATLKLHTKMLICPILHHILGPGPFTVRFRRTGSDRPKQILQFEEIGFLLPAFNADLANGIAHPMEEKQRHQPALQGRRQVGARISKSLEQAANPPRDA